MDTERDAAAVRLTAVLRGIGRGVAVAVSGAAREPADLGVPASRVTVDNGATAPSD